MLRSRGTGAHFVDTEWSVVLAAQGEIEPASRREALEKLCQTYRAPIYGFLRRRGFSQHDSDDLAQSFFYHLLDQPFLKNVGPEKGRFRTFLLTSLDRFLINNWNRQKAQKRGGNLQSVSLECMTSELAAASDQEVAAEYDRLWARALVETTFSRLRFECSEAGKLPLFDELRGIVLRREDPVDSSRIAERLGMTPNAVRQVRCRLRRRFRQLLIEAIAETLVDVNEVDDEARYLLSICSNDKRD